MNIPITVNEAQRLHAACKMIEVDGEGAYWSCRERYGEAIANAALVMWLRRVYSDDPLVHPPEDDLPIKVNEVLQRNGIMELPRRAK